MDRDTAPLRRERYVELLRGMSAAERLQKASALSVAVRTLAEAGIRQLHPAASREELRIRLAARLYGRETAQRLYGEVPTDAR